MRRLTIVLAAAVCFASGLDAHAHFLFVRIGPHAEAGRHAEVYFSEVAQAGDPQFIDKIAHTQLWLQHTPGDFQPLKVHKAADRLRAYLPVWGSVVLVGECQYGVIARPEQVPFLLRYYPKAMAGRTAELNAMRPRAELPLEIVATVDDEQITFTALRAGKPMPDAVFTTVDAELANEQLSAGSDGRATWKPPTPGQYSVYVRQVTKQSGELDGKKYDEIREFATLAFTWPLERRGPDAEAAALFDGAVAARAQWTGFPGFTADIAGVVDGRPFDGTVAVRADGTVKLETAEAAVESWVTEQLESIAMHRGARPAGDADSDRPKPVFQFADDDLVHPLGRLLAVAGGQFASSYRVKDKQIMVVNRRVGRFNMTITVLDNGTNSDGKFLPQSYTVQYWDSKTGQLDHTETVQDRWHRVGSWDLPVSHTVTRSSESGLAVRSFTLSKQALAQE